MSNQEAIALLRNLEDSLDAYCELNEEGKTAFRMAIEALGCSEFPNSSDSISRQAAIDALDVGAEVLRRVLDEADVVGVERAKYEWGLGLIESHIADVNDLPSVQPERKKGKKIVKSNGRMGYWACDKCGETIHPDDNFCPNCGVDLRGE